MKAHLMLFFSCICLPVPGFAFDPPVPSKTFWTKNSAMINFEADVKLPSCTVWAGWLPKPLGDNTYMHVGFMRNLPEAEGPILPLGFQFKDCDASVQTISNIEYTKDLKSWPNSQTAPIGATWISTSNPKIRLYLYDDPAGDRPSKLKEFKPSESVDPNKVLVPFYIQARNFTKEEATSGEFEAEAQFTITYN